MKTPPDRHNNPQNPLMNDPQAAISLKQFLLIEQCPEAWKAFDLYLFRDETMAFYIGQSQLAFARVWDHLTSGFKGRSIIGRFIWCNWPISMKFTIELLSSQAEQFKCIGNDVNSAEQLLIQNLSPCLNICHNKQPTSLPDTYWPPNAKLRCSRSLNKLIREAERAVRREESNR